MISSNFKYENSILGTIFFNKDNCYFKYDVNENTSNIVFPINMETVISLLETIRQDAKDIKTEQQFYEYITMSIGKFQCCLAKK